MYLLFRKNNFMPYYKSIISSSSVIDILAIKNILQQINWQLIATYDFAINKSNLFYYGLMIFF